MLLYNSYFNGALSQPFLHGEQLLPRDKFNTLKPACFTFCQNNMHLLAYSSLEQGPILVLCHSTTDKQFNVVITL